MSIKGKERKNCNIYYKGICKDKNTIRLDKGLVCILYLLSGFCPIYTRTDELYKNVHKYKQAMNGGSKEIISTNTTPVHYDK